MSSGLETSDVVSDVEDIAESVVKKSDFPSSMVARADVV